MPTMEPVAITREPAAELGSCELSYVPRTAVDAALALRQHRAYQRALATLGCRVLTLEAEPEMPDAVFVEDVAVVLDEVAVMTRPGAASRRGEGMAVSELLMRYRPLRHIEPPGTLDGGDVLRIGRTLYVGRSARSNDDGIAQLAVAVDGFGYRVQPVAMRGCLHLKSAVTALDDATVLVQPEWVDVDAFASYRRIEVDPGEAHAANVLRLAGGIVMPSGFPRTQARIAEAGFDAVAVDMSELQKLEGAVTCCSLVFEVAT